METLLGFLWPVLWGIGLALFTTSPILLPIFLRYLAERDVFFTLVEEGRPKAIMRGEEFRRFVMAYQGYKFDKNWDIVPKEEGKEERKATLVPEFLRQWFEKRLGGIRWLGWPFLDTVYEYNFRWTVLRESKASEDEEGFVSQRPLPSGKQVVSFAKRLDYILVKDFVYYNELVGAETGGEEKTGEWELMPIDVLMLLPTRIINPYKALFRTHKWLDTTQDLIKPSIRAWVASVTYREVVQKKEVAEREFDTFLVMTGVKAPQKDEKQPKPISAYLEDTYGVRVKRITFEDVVPPKEYSDAATSRVKAEQKKKEIETLAEAEAERVKTSYAPILAKGEAGLAIRALEAIEEASKGPGNTIVTVGPGLVKDLIGLAAGVKVKEGGA